MLIYIWIRFEWQFSLGSILALFHDVIITVGIFSILSLEVNLSIIAAVLTIVGYSMNDTVVIYDRIRENLGKYTKLKINDISNLSINETLSRTIITSATTLLALISIYTSHSADRKVHEIEKLSEARQELEAEYTETKEKLTDLSLESKVLRKAKELGLTAPSERPDKIVVEE